MGPDPLLDTLFRPTVAGPVAASAAPVRETGTRTRAGNAMSRTRSALLYGARRAVEASGTKITMAQVAASAGVAKATLYNHFRTREAVLMGLLADEVARVCAQGERACAEQGLAAGLAAAADSLSANSLIRALARQEPATLARLARIDVRSEGWREARAAVERVLATHSRRGVDTVLRWLASFLLSPAEPAAVASDLAILLTGLPGTPPPRAGLGGAGSTAHSA